MALRAKPFSLTALQFAIWVCESKMLPRPSLVQTALGAPDFSQAVGVGELDIPAIRGVGGCVVHFIDERSDLHRVWDIEFDPVRPKTVAQPAGLRRIDHVCPNHAPR